ncbi:MAG TPA: VOC family protein [Pirellulaceae bacterium]|nr:VOC family protein [Pirellulaceae bacterium]
MPKISPFLWFNDQAEEASEFYTAIFPNSKILHISHYAEGGPAPAGSVMTVAFELDGQAFTALNGGPHFKFSEAISFVVSCDTQAEIDSYWDQLSAGGQQVQCGWLKDKYGLSWQIVPALLGQLMSSPDPKQGQRVMQALMQMTKLDIAKLKQAAEQPS